MRFLLFINLCILISGTAAAQDNFEGTITYAVKENSKPVGRMTVEFAPSMMRASFEEEGGMERKEIFVLFDSLLVAEVNHQTREVRATYYKDPGAQFSGPVEIGGHKTSLVGMGRKSSILGYFPGAAFFVADDLFYKIPAAMTGLDELMMLNNGKIVLGFVLPDKSYGAVTSFDSSFNDPEFRGVIAKATSITPKKQDPSLFVIPKDYVREAPAPDYEGNDLYSDSLLTAIDSTAAMIDSISEVMVDTSTIIFTDPTDSAEFNDLPPPPPPRKPATKKKPAVKKTKTPPAARKPE